MNLNISFQMTSTIDAKSNSGNVEYKKIQFCFEKEASVWILKFQIELILFFEKTEMLRTCDRRLLVTWTLKISSENKDI